MKVLFQLLLLLSVSLTKANSLQHLNTNGFPICYANNGQVFFFTWDQMVRTPTKQVFYFNLKDYMQATGHSLNGCEDVQHLQTIPDDILKPIHPGGDELFPSSILLALDQVAHGAHQFTAENSNEEFIHNRPQFFQTDRPEILSQLRFQVGDRRAESIIGTWSKTIFADIKQCDSYIGTCDFYLCQEKKNPCGVDGYNLGFGYKYCSGSKFQLLPKMNTGNGQNWVKNVFKCLQRKSFIESLATSKTKTCETIQKTSIASHPECYVEAGFCKLSYQERISILNLIKAEIFSSDTVAQGLKILQLCHSQDAQ